MRHGLLTGETTTAGFGRTHAVDVASNGPDRISGPFGVLRGLFVRIWDLPAGCLRKEDSKPKVYLIENNTKRWVTSPQVLTGLGKAWADVKSVPFPTVRT